MSVNRKIFVELIPSTEKVRPAFQGVKTEVSGLSRHVQRQSQAMRSALDGVIRSVGTFSRRFAAGLTVGLGAGVKVAGDFQEAMRNVNSIAKQSESAFRATSREVLNLNREIGTAQRPILMANALYEINSAGFQARDGLKVLRESTHGADAGLTTASVAADGLTTTLKAFNLKADESRRAMDLMFKTVELGKLTFEDLASNTGKAATFMSAAGVKVEEYHAGLAILTAKGLSAEESVVALRGAVKGILKPSAEAITLSDELGLSYGKQALEQKGLIKLLQEMERATKGDTAQIAQLLGDVRGLNAGLGLLSNDGGKAALKVLQDMRNADGATMAALAQRTKSVNFQMKRLLSSLESVTIQLTQGFLPMASRAAQIAQEWADRVAKLTDEQKQMIAKLAAVTAGVTALVGVGSGVIAWLAAMKVSLASIGITGFGAAISGVVRVIGGFLSRINGVTLAISALAAAWLSDWAGIRSATSATLRDIWSVISGAFGDIMSSAGELGQEIASIMGEVFDSFKAMADYVGDDFRTIVVLVLEAVKVTLIALIETTRLFLKTTISSMKLIAAIMEGDFSRAHEIAKRNVEQFQADVTRGWGRITTAYEQGEERIDASVNRTHKSFIEQVKESLRQGEERAQRFSTSVEGTFSTLSDAIAKNIKDSTGQSIQSFAEMRKAAEVESTRISEAFSKIGGGVVSGASALGKAPGQLGQLLRSKLGIGNAPTSAAPGPGGGGKKKGDFDRATAAAFIRGNAKAGSNLSGLGRLDDRTLSAMEQGLKNALKEGLELKFHSTFRSGSKGHHGSGQAFDVSAFGQGVTAANDARVIAKLFAGTGATAVIDENRQAVLNRTGGRGAHSHVTTGFQRQFQGTDGRDAVIPIAGGSIAADLAQEEFKKAEQAHKEHLEAKEHAEHAHHEFLLRGLDEFNRQRVELVEQFNQEEANQKAGLITPEQLEQAKAAFLTYMQEINQAEIEQMEASRERRAAENEAAIEDLAKKSLAMQEAGAALDEQHKAEHEKKIERQLAEFNHMVELDQLTYEQKVLFFENMLALEMLNTEQRRQLEVNLHNLRKQHEQEALQSNQAFTQQISGTFQQFLVQTLSGQQKFSSTFQNLWKSVMNTIITEISKAIIKALALKKILGGLFGGFGFFHSGGVVGAGGGLLAGAGAGVFHGGGLVLPQFHNGGTVGPGGIFRGGLRPDEIVAKLQTGEAVLPRSLVRQLRSGGDGARTTNTSLSIGEYHAHGDQDVTQLSKQIAWQSYAYGKGG